MGGETEKTVLWRGAAGYNRDLGRRLRSGKTSGVGLAVEVGGMETCLAMWSKTGMRVKNWVRKSGAAQYQGRGWEGESVHGG